MLTRANKIKITVTASLLILFHMPVIAQEIGVRDSSTRNSGTPDSRVPDRRGQVDASVLPFLKMHYQPEYDLDAPTNKRAWLEQKSGLHVSFSTTDKAYFRTEVPEQGAPSGRAGTDSWEATGWRGERLNAQILVWSPDSLEQVRFTLHDLAGANGKLISRRNIRLRLVRYVLSNYPYGAKDAVCGETPYKNAYLMPDRLETFERFDLPGRTVRPVWLSLDVPADAGVGLYTGNILVSTTKYSMNLRIKIKVQRHLLPPPHDWQYRLDLWQNPWVVAWKNHLQPWSEEHKTLLKKHLRLYADAGGKYITTYAVHSPWSDNSYSAEGGMIEWIKKKGGSGGKGGDGRGGDGWKFDYTIFDGYVELAMTEGINKAITIYTPIPGGDRFRYLDESTGNYIFESWAPGSDQYRDHWNIFLTDLMAHLRKKGWLEKTYIGINESEMNQTLAAIKVIRAHSKNWKITYAGDWHKELDGLLDDYSFLYGKEPSADELKERAARGATSTFYVCCNPPKPNNFVFSPPIEGRWISWYSAASGYNGFLRWAYDAWPEDPVRDARFGSWPAGDCYLVYPGAGSSVRYEKLREGIADYEKIRILRASAAGSADKKLSELWKAFQQHLKVFTAEHDFNEEKITADVNKGKAMIDELSELLP